MKKANIIISTYGNGIAVGLQGTKDQIEQSFNRFFNWGAAAPNITFMRSNEDCETNIGDMGDSYLHEIFDGFCYFLSTEQDMIKALASEYLFNWQDTSISKQYKGVRNNKKIAGLKFREDAQNAAREEFNSYTKENFMLYNKSESPLFKVSDGGAPSYDSSSMTFGEVARTYGYKSRLAPAV
jgi:hypothetical protein